MKLEAVHWLVSGPDVEADEHYYRVVLENSLDRGVLYAILEARGIFGARLEVLSPGNIEHNALSGTIYHAEPPQDHAAKHLIDMVHMFKERNLGGGPALEPEEEPEFALWDELGRLKARFYVGFGDPSSRNRGWDVGPVYLWVGTNWQHPVDGHVQVKVYWEAPELQGKRI